MVHLVTKELWSYWVKEHLEQDLSIPLVREQELWSNGLLWLQNIQSFSS